MESCPICDSNRPAAGETCVCGYDFDKKEIVDHNLLPAANVEKIRSYYQSIKNSKDWIKEVTLKIRITEVQVAKYGRSGPGTHANYKWANNKTARVLGEGNNMTSPDIELAYAFNLYPELSECASKSEAKAKLKELNPRDELARHFKKFRSEKKLQNYLEKNWREIPLFSKWDLKGSKFTAGDAGQIDLLAHDPGNSEWIVIELKKGYSPDKTIGQIQRYMGWVKENMAESQKVRGIIISGYPPDKLIKYALSGNPDIQHKIYYLFNDKFNIEDADAGIFGEEFKQFLSEYKKESTQSSPL